jgi:hypothetical protein
MENRKTDVSADIMGANTLVCLGKNQYMEAGLMIKLDRRKLI